MSTRPLRPISTPALIGIIAVIAWDMWHRDVIGLLLFALTLIAMHKALYWWEMWRGR